jgi:hypothetical protein
MDIVYERLGWAFALSDMSAVFPETAYMCLVLPKSGSNNDSDVNPISSDSEMIAKENVP